MRKLKLQVQISLDGFIAGPNHEMNWMKLPWTEDISRYVESITKPVDTILLGKHLAQGFIPHWEMVASNPENPEYEAGVKFSFTPKVVFSNSLEECTWNNTRIASGSLEEEVSTLKNQVGGDIIAYGGATLVSTLIEKDLIDEYHLFINPVILGKGLAIFNCLLQPKFLELKECLKFECGVGLMVYLNNR